MKCRKCGNELTDKYSYCPICGKKISTFSWWKVFFVFVGLMLVVSIFNDNHSDDNETNKETKTSVTNTTDENTTEQSAVAVEPAKNYVEEQSIDKISGKVAKYITIQSDNQITFDFPYNGEQHGELLIRNHPRMGHNIMVSVEKGQIICDSYDGCNVSVGFSDLKNGLFSASGPSDNSTNTLFINNYKRFMKHLKNSKSVYIELSFFQEGNRTLEFAISDELRAKLIKEGW